MFKYGVIIKRKLNTKQKIIFFTSFILLFIFWRKINKTATVLIIRRKNNLLLMTNINKNIDIASIKNSNRINMEVLLQCNRIYIKNGVIFKKVELKTESYLFYII